jgi:hypothetical protein
MLSFAAWMIVGVVMALALVGRYGVTAAISSVVGVFNAEGRRVAHRHLWYAFERTTPPTPIRRARGWLQRRPMEINGESAYRVGTVPRAHQARASSEKGPSGSSARHASRTRACCSAGSEAR